MRFPAAAILALFGVCSTAASAQIVPRQAAPQQRVDPSRQVGHVRGTAIDGSGGVLPGVTVAATLPDGRVVATTITDATGAYVFKALPAGRLRFMFQLEGFAIANVDLTIRPRAESVAIGHLELAPRAETVVVHGTAPVNPPYHPAFRMPTPPPLLPVPPHDAESVCGPAKAAATVESFGTIRSRRYDVEPGLYAKRDELVIDGGTLNGLEAGQHLVVRRTYRVSGAAGAAATFAIGEHTSGLVQIVASDERESIAVVVYACDEMMKGDVLAAFEPEPLRIPESIGIPVYADAARILFADAGQTLGVARRLMVIDQGREQGIRAGQRLTLFRRARRGAASPTVVGDAVVVAVRNASATIRVEHASDVILFGDWAAPQKSTEESRYTCSPICSNHF